MPRSFALEAARKRWFAGEMDDIAGGSGGLEERGEAVGAFGFYGFGAAGLVPLGSGLAFGDELLLQASDKFRVFAVRGDDDTEFFREGQGLIHLAVVNAEEVLVGEEDLEGS